MKLLFQIVKDKLCLFLANDNPVFGAITASFFLDAIKFGNAFDGFFGNG